MNSYEKNSKSFDKAIRQNDFRTRREQACPKYAHEVQPFCDIKSKFDMTEKYFKTHMQEKKNKQ